MYPNNKTINIRQITYYKQTNGIVKSRCQNDYSIITRLLSYKNIDLSTPINLMTRTDFGNQLDFRGFV